MEHEGMRRDTLRVRNDGIDDFFWKTNRSCQIPCGFERNSFLFFSFLMHMRHAFARSSYNKNINVKFIDKRDNLKYFTFLRGREDAEDSSSFRTILFRLMSGERNLPSPTGIRKILH